jgi:immune inhibitor A
MPTKILRYPLLAALFLLLAAPSAWAAVVVSNGVADAPGRQARSDNHQTKLDVKKAALLQKGLQAKLKGIASGKTYRVASGQYVQLARDGEQAVWTVLGQFADFPHNNIAAPDRTVDNTTLWVPDFSRGYYLDLLFNDAAGANSMRNFYIEQSSGRFAVNGDVTDWVTVPHDAAYYDDNKGGVDTTKDVWLFLQDSVNGWYAAQKAAGKTDAEINAYLSSFDKQDRYDYNGNGNFNEPDGYIDTFQSVHSGEGEEAGGGALGSTAIWSHSWYANPGDMGVAGPDFNKLGGVRVGNSNYWVGKYTIQPENGGVGVFVHEFGHDLGLPDLYDTSGGENGTAFWTLMSSGSWLDDGKDTIGNKASHMGAWEKFQLGWLNYQVATAGQSKDIKLGPMETNTKQAQAVFVILPKKSVTSVIGTPYAGTKFYYSGAGDNLDNVMDKSVSLGAGSTLTAKVQYDIETDWDYAYVVVSTDGGTTWTGVPTNLSTSTDPNGQNFGNGITGGSGGNWVDLSADLSAYSGNVLVGFRYWTDGAAGGVGFMADEVSIGGSAPDGAETDTGWTYKPATGGFRVTSGTESALFNNYYVVESRQYIGYDKTLKVGPYFFGYLNDPALQNYVDHFPYQDGVLINYWDTSQADNNTSEHPGQGLILPIDAHPKALVRIDGKVWRNRIQNYDATFGLYRTDAIGNVHVNSVLSPIPSLPAVPVFDDRKSYYDPANPWGSVIVPNTNTQIRIVSYSALGNFLQIQVRPAK